LSSAAKVKKATLARQAIHARAAFVSEKTMQLSKNETVLNAKAI
jgi:hypothetical protein